MTKYYVDANGNYLGGFDGAKPPKRAIEVTTPPDHGEQKWDGMKWLPCVQTFEQRNADTLSQITALDMKRIRPLAEGDTAYLATLNTQIAALRATLK